MRVSNRLRRWREGKVRPLQGNAPHDRLVSRVIFLSLRSVCDDPFSATPLPLCESISGRPKMRFLRHRRNLSVRCRAFVKTQAWTKSHCLPPAAPDPSQRTCREEHALLIVQMSSGRLFLDRVARQHCPSPLHRQPDHKTVDRGDERIYYRTVTVSFPRVSP